MHGLRHRLDNQCVCQYLSKLKRFCVNKKQGKPEKLTHDASTSTFRTWKKQFRAYFESAQLGTLPCSQQQAYLCNCLDSVLRARIDREDTGTTPVYTPIAGLLTCMAILDQTFLEAYPIHVRQKHFFDARQKEGQSAIEFREELLCLLEEVGR